MNTRSRKFLAISSGLLFVIVGIAIAFLGQFFIANLGDILIADKAKLGWQIPDETSPFYTFLVLGLCVAAGLCVTAFMWSPRPGYAVRFTTYVILLAALLPVAAYNYAHADYLVNRSAQAVLNVFLVFGGTVVTIELFLYRASTRDLLVVQLLAVLALSLVAVFIPAMFSTVWLLNSLGVISAAVADSVGTETISIVSGFLSAVVAGLKFRRDVLSAEGSPAEGSRKPQDF